MNLKSYKPFTCNVFRGLHSVICQLKGKCSITASYHDGWSGTCHSLFKAIRSLSFFYNSITNIVQVLTIWVNKSVDVVLAIRTQSYRRWKTQSDPVSYGVHPNLWNNPRPHFGNPSWSKLARTSSFEMRNFGFEKVCFRHFKKLIFSVWRGTFQNCKTSENIASESLWAVE